MDNSQALIGISVGALHYWVDDKYWPEAQLGLIDVLTPYVKRIEIRFGFDDLFSVSNELVAAHQQKLEGVFTSLHMPSLTADISRLNQAVAKIDEIVERTGIEYCVMHADDFAKIKIWQLPFNLKAKIALENSDLRKFGFQHLEDLTIFPDLPAVVDINHLEEIKAGSLAEELSTLKNSIHAIHFSSTKNEGLEKYPYYQTTHYPFFNSGLNPPLELPAGVPIIIEGMMPKDQPEYIAGEVEIIRKAYFG